MRKNWRTGRVGEKMSVFMKNPNNNSVNHGKSLFFKTDEMASPLNPE